MRVVADTNTVVSALLWRGQPHQLLVAAREQRIELFTSVILLDELIEVLQRDKFARHLARVGGTPRGLALRFAHWHN